MSRVPIFGSLSGEQQAVVAGYARATRLGREQQLYGPGDRVGRLFVVHTGRVKVLRVASNGAEALVRTAGPGDVVGELAFVTGERPDHRVVAMDAVSLCVFDHRDLAAILAAYPGVVMRMLQAVTRRLEAAEARLASMSSVDVTGGRELARLRCECKREPGSRVVQVSPGEFLDAREPMFHRVVVDEQLSGGFSPVANPEVHLQGAAEFGAGGLVMQDEFTDLARASEVRGGTLIRKSESVRPIQT